MLVMVEYTNQYLNNHYELDKILYPKVIISHTCLLHLFESIKLLWKLLIE